MQLAYLATSLSVFLLPVATVSAATPKLVPVAATASHTVAGSSPAHVLDGNPATFWNSGGGPSKWLQIDLGETRAISKVRLHVTQSSPGWTKHVVLAGSDPASLRVLATSRQTTSEGQWLEFSRTLSANDSWGGIRYVRIRTDESPSWVAWSDIEIYGTVGYFGYFADAYAGVGLGNYMSETSAVGANVTWVSGDPANYVASLTAKLIQAHNLGLKVIIGTKAIESNGAQVPPSHHELTADAVRSAYPEDIIAFAIIDEPYCFAGASSITEESVHAAILATKATLQELFDCDAVDDICVSEQPKFLTIFSGPEVDNLANNSVSVCGSSANGVPMTLDASNLAPFDWVGLNCYDTWANCLMNPRVASLRSRLSANQQMVAVPWAYIGGTSTAPQAQTTTIAVLDQWHRELKADANYALVAPFVWAPGSPDPANRYARDLPEVKQRLRNLSASLGTTSSLQIFPVSVAASATGTGSIPFNATDNSTSTSWTAGGSAPQHIVFDFGGPARFSRIEMTPSMFPNGQTTQEIAQSADGVTWQVITTLTQASSDNVAIIYNGLSSTLRYVRIRTTAAPSWVAWREVRFFR